MFQREKVKHGKFRDREKNIQRELNFIKLLVRKNKYKMCMERDKF